MEICAPVSIEKSMGLSEFDMERGILISLLSKMNLCGMKMFEDSGLFSALQSKMLPDSHFASIRFLQHLIPPFPTPLAVS